MPTSGPEGQARLHAIGEVAAATGITPETLRIWERRYGRPEAVRLPSGHRRYTDAQVTWLRRVAEALAHGHRPRQVLALDDEALDRLLAEAAGPVAEDEEIERLLGWIERLRGVELRAALEARWNPDDVTGFVARRVAPLLRAVGRAWADGRLDVRHEHFASEIVEDTLRHLRAGFPRTSDRGGVLLATLPGEIHGLGLQMAALVCAARGVPCHVLGVDTPVEEIVRAAEEFDARVVALSVSLHSGGVETDRALAALRAELPERVRVVAGGEGVRSARRGPRDVQLVADLGAWAQALDDLA